jgi:hypothetical protein
MNLADRRAATDEEFKCLDGIELYTPLRVAVRAERNTADVRIAELEAKLEIIRRIVTQHNA